MIESLSLFNIAIAIVSLILAMTLHEAVHAYTGYLLGDDTAKEQGRVTLNPIKHIDPFSTILLPVITLIVFSLPILAAKPVPFNPARVKFEEFGAAMIAFAGPLTNLILAIIAGFILKIFQGSLGEEMIVVFTLFIFINIALFVFNMIPIPPLDGSRVLYAFAPEPLQDFMASLERIGIFIVFTLVLFVPAFFQFIIDLNQKVLNIIL